MKIARIESLHADAGWRAPDFFRITAKGVILSNAKNPSLT
jgi:hypothetical protein